MKYAVITFGCRVNQADSLGFEEALLAQGAVAVEPAAADVVIVNTCSVTATADQGARQTIRRIARDNPAVKIVVTGCYATRRPDEIRELPNVARVVANDDKPRLLPIVAQGFGPVAQGFSPVAQGFSPAFRDGDGACGAAIEPGVAGRTAFTLRVQTGCAEPCSYCIIPATRGAPRSVPIAEVVREVERVVEAGFKEIALTGVHLGSYGRDLAPPTSLIDLLRALDDWHGLKTVSYNDHCRGRSSDRPDVISCRERSSDRSARVLFRISSLEPMDCSREIVDLVASSDRFAPHFHLPLQHASNRVLRAMRRPYAIEQYDALVTDIRAKIRHASIGSDIIVGFPGETDDDFERLCGYLDASPLTHIHVFPYSDRPGTVASSFGGKVPGPVVRERGRRVRAIGHEQTKRFHRSQLGVVHRALTLEDGSLVVTGNYLKLRIAPGRARNEWVDVRVLSERDGELLAG